MIAVATLLVAVVGATFAYFTATTTPTGKGDEVNVNSAKVANVNLTMAPETVSNVQGDIYPGVMLAAGANVKAEYDGESSGANYSVIYTLNAEVDLSAFTESESEFTYSLYKGTSGSVKQPVTNCEKQEKLVSNSTQFSYINCAASGDLTLVDGYENKELTISNNTIEVPNQELKVGETAYYYLIVNYKNKDDDQTDTDNGKQITLKIVSATNGQLKQNAA